MTNVKAMIEQGNTALGIELGSTRVKAVLIGEDQQMIAQGAFDWENQLVDGFWTYDEATIWKGIQQAYLELATAVKAKVDVPLTTIGSIGFSAMMHGYMVFGADDQLLVPFRTWRNNLQEQAANALTDAFNYQIPQRWSIAHLYQAVLNDEAHVKDIKFQTTLAGYVHWQLTGEKTLGVGEASGMFPIDLNTKHFNQIMIKQFDQLVEAKDYPWSLNDILPSVKVAGEAAGILTEAGARRLDPSGLLKAGIPLCPPEGDAGTGMVATNSVKPKTGNVSAGTSVFAMVVLEKELSKVYPEIDLVTTPSGHLVAMAHSNNCTSDLNAWVALFKEYSETMGIEVDMETLYGTLYRKALEGDKDAGGLLSYGYLSGEHMTHFEEGRPLFVRGSKSVFNLANFMRTHLYSSLGAMKIGMDILLKAEGVSLEEMLGHGGLFKTKGVGQAMMAAALDTPVSVMDTAGEGGAWGIAVLAEYMIQRNQYGSLDEFLTEAVFKKATKETVKPHPADVEGFEVFMTRYKEGLPIERAAVDLLN
ncbi:sugar (pentulose or hexulose) kinase [Streptohalobacillus salinus]|uniref:Sugar (Pentulose or hexulose) kinase n=1 Tax=Streptohalobacillus salinus TaxID=621096 RepID=A0A2V3W9G2_9BACI|nr:FGGY-family carbohydrate kinase [Streptohalobacillus salinus]PXW91003.1 sugar (pentulose or hexulose) kinase [Streptohalobacillus salinus]